MIEEKKNLEFTNEELIEFIHTQRKMMCMEEYYLIRKELLDKVKRVLDLRDLVKITASNHKKTRKIINKYAKQSRKESDTKKLFKKQQVKEEMIATRYLHSVMGLMEIVYKILYTDAFEKDLPALEKWYEFEMEDMILVNGLVKGLKYCNSLDVTEDDVIGALNFAVEQYVECIENNTEYADIFDKSFPFVQLNKEEENADE